MVDDRDSISKDEKKAESKDQPPIPFDDALRRMVQSPPKHREGDKKKGVAPTKRKKTKPK